MHYSVDLTGGITESFFKDLQHTTGSHLLLSKRLPGVTIELFQNISKHAINMNSSTLIIQKESATYSVNAINIIPAEDVQRLRKRTNCINTLDYAKLKEKHKTIPGNTTRSKKSGAGSGFYRIVLRSTSTLVPVFRQIDQHYFTFSLHVTPTA